MTQQIGFIGGGNMAGSLMGGLIKADPSCASNFSVFEPNAERAAQLHSEFGVTLVSDNVELIQRSNVVVIAVKPQVLKKVLQPLKEVSAKSRPLIISIVAGIRIDSIVEWLGVELPIVRAMPNTPALVSAGATGLYANSLVSESQKLTASKIVDAVGISEWVNEEHGIDTVTALSGSAPAYFMLFIDALIKAGVDAGMTQQAAKNLAVATAGGTAKLIEHSDCDIQTLIDNVTSPGGTTERAVQSLKKDQLSNVVERAFEAARLRAQELAEELA